MAARPPAKPLRSPALPMTRWQGVVNGTELPVNVLHVATLPDLHELARLGVRGFSAGSGIFQVINGEFHRLAQSFLNQGTLGENAGEPMAFGTLQGLFTGKV